LRIFFHFKKNKKEQKVKSDQGLPPPPPPDLEERFQNLWMEHIHRMNPGKMITFEACLYALQRAEQARRMVDRQGLTLTTKKSGMRHINPLLRVEKENRDMGLKLWRMLGLNSTVVSL